jgi:enoyl-CoA hydratase/carnithine racemase
VTINRPDKLNAISPELKRALVEHLLAADADPATSVVVLRAEGRSFSAGYDISPSPARAARRGNALAWHDSLADDIRLEMTPWDMRKPVIASVQGHCLGGGCELMMLCDLAIAADDAVFGEPEIRFSNVGPALVMPFVVGLRRARELLYLGDPIDAPTALAYGMVNRVVPRAQLQAATLKLARRMALISPESLVATKLATRRGAESAGFRNAILAGLDVLAPLYAARTEVGMKFDEIREKEGLGAALKWRAAQFAD